MHKHVGVHGVYLVLSVCNETMTEAGLLKGKTELKNTIDKWSFTYDDICKMQNR